MNQKWTHTEAVLLAAALLLSGCGAVESTLPTQSNPTEATLNSYQTLPSDESTTPPQASGNDVSDQTPIPEDEKLGFQKDLNVTDEFRPFRLNELCRGNGGYYLENEGLLYFLEPESGKMLPVCGKPNCSHKDNTCNAWINPMMLTYYQDKIYFINEDGGESCLYTMNPDGTERRKVQTTKMPDRNSTRTFMSTDIPMLYNGKLYYMDDDTLCVAELGKDRKDATVLMKENREATQRESHWKFWADKGNIYAMQQVLTKEGYIDTLYRLYDDKAHELWSSSVLWSLSSNKDISDGKASWYLSDGILYYYVSGGEVWKADLNNNDVNNQSPSLLFKNTDVGMGGSAIFNQKDIFILNDQMEEGPFRRGGKTVSIYDFNGDFQRKIDLSPVYELHKDTVHVELVFADSKALYLLGSRGMANSAQNNLYQVNLESGQLREITDWPHAGTDYQAPEQQHGEIG